MKRLLDCLVHYFKKELNQTTTIELYRVAGNSIKVSNLETFLQKYGDFLTAYRNNPKKMEKVKSKDEIQKIESRLVELLDWTVISKYGTFSSDFVERYIRHIRWHHLAQNKLSMSVDMYERFEDHLDINDVLAAVPMPEGFLQKYIDIIDLGVLYTHQNLSEAFLERNMYRGKETKLLHYMISETQHLSLSFIQRHEKEMNFLALSMNPKVTEDVVAYYFDKLDLYLLDYKKINFDTAIKHLDRIDLDEYKKQVTHLLTNEECKQLDEIIYMKKAFESSK